MSGTDEPKDSAASQSAEAGSNGDASAELKPEQAGSAGADEKPPERDAAPAAAKEEPPEKDAAPAAAKEDPPDPPDPPDEESAPDSAIEVEPIVFEPKQPKRTQSGQHLPPPPPSTRIKGGASRLEVGKNPKLASDLMTKKIFTIGPSDIIEHLEEHMQAFRFRHLPVVEGRKLVGLITHSDLLHASSSFLSDQAIERDALIHKQPAKRIMQTELITVRPSEPLAEVAVLMWEGRVGCVLVTEEDATLVGIITEGDFIRLAHHFLVEQR